MECDLIYPESESEMFDAPCIVAAVYFDDEELISFGLNESAFELDNAFIDLNEFEKAFELWNSPLYLSNFYDEYRSFFQQDYWREITERDFLEDVTRSVTRIKDTLIQKMEKNDFPSLVAPLDTQDEEKRMYDSIRVKIKQGSIDGHHPFRFYAIEIEENKCYLITGATIKVHKDMLKAPNTTIEMRKLEHILNILTLNEVNTKDTFIDYYLKQERN